MATDFSTIRARHRRPSNHPPEKLHLQSQDAIAVKTTSQRCTCQKHNDVAGMPNNSAVECKDKRKGGGRERERERERDYRCTGMNRNSASFFAQKRISGSSDK